MPQNAAPGPLALAASMTSRSSHTEDINLVGMPKRLLRDQEVIWTSPARLRPKDAMWLVPFGVATGMLVGSDQHSMTKAIQITPDGQNKANTLSNGALAGIVAIPASGYLWSLVNYAPQAHETGLLAGEALINSYAVNTALKAVFRRDRPLVNNAAGNFFSSGATDSSFPSNHAVLAWSAAAVVASEYPGWLTRTAVYGLASSVSVSRVLAEQHFPSDVLVGSVAGWMIGRYVYKAHHSYTLNPYDSPPLPDNYVARNTSNGAGPQLPTPPPPPQFALPSAPAAKRTLVRYDGDPDAIGSTNVPMDSWIYPALERLANLGLISTQNVSIRPWTRQECKRQLEQAEELADRLSISNPGLVNEAKRLMADLDRELSEESTSYQELALESVYARYGTIAGPALYDSFHFGQTWWNDYGRPLGRGSSAIAGFSTRAHYGRLFFYAREEMQHGPGRPNETPERNQLINTIDFIQPGDPHIEPVPGSAAFTRQRPLELYAGVSFAGNALSFGKQQIYWGPTTMGPWAFSSNAEPTYNFRFVSTRPHPFPLVPSWGTYRFDVVLGKLSGHSYPARPWFNGQKISLNFGDNLELGFTRWSVFLGVGHPMTLHTFKDNIFSFNSTGGGIGGGGGSAGYGDRGDPGDRKSNFDFRYRLPYFGKFVTLYADAYSDDDPNPMAAPRRAAWSPGIYFARLPWLPHMDLRVEAASSQGLVRDFGGIHFFINNQYLDSNTNKGFLLGNAVGRDGRAIEGRTGYWFSSRTRVELGYRQNKIANGYLPQGGTITDGFLNGSFAINRHWTAQVFTQYERFLIPSYKPGSQNNTSGWLQITWNPELSLREGFSAK
ncbi:MAG: phosphatase PAP2 family protein [Acidobacteria bacterium]|nr:phosphatase PAP2 family protein [Acidobacteriota bacterium]